MKGRVLVVDDDTALAEMLGIVLRGEGFEPFFCADGAKAFDAFRETRPDLVLLDLMLPGARRHRRRQADPGRVRRPDRDAHGQGRYRRGDLLDAARLFLAAHIHFVHQHLHLGRAACDLLNGAGHQLQLLVALVGFGDRFLNQGGRIFGGLSAAMRQVAHFVGDHGETHSGFSGPGGFHGRIQRQDVGLKRDFVDHANDLGDLFAGGIDFFHGLDHLFQIVIGIFHAV